MFFLYCEIAGESFNRDILESLEPRCISLMSGMTAISLARLSVVKSAFRVGSKWAWNHLIRLQFSPFS